jgi:hypothetical protein
MRSSSTLKSAGVILLAVVVALVAWALIRLLGVEPTAVEVSAPAPVGAADVAVAASGAGLGAWGVCAWLAQRRATRWWPLVGSTALAVSMVGPSWLADGASAAALICLHVAVGLVLITGLARFVPGARRVGASRSGPV